MTYLSVATGGSRCARISIGIRRLSMYEVTIYNDLQHEQHRCPSDRIVVCETSVGSGRWSPGWESEIPVGDGALALRAAEGAVTIDAAVAGLKTVSGRELNSGEELLLPCLLKVGKTWIEIAKRAPARQLAPLKQTNLDELLNERSADDAHSGPSSATVTRWLNEAGKLHRAAAGSAEFYADAARFAVDTVGLDAAWVLRREDRREHAPWQIAGSCLPHPERGIRFDPSALEYFETRLTAWYQPTDDEATQRFAQSIVVAPVLDKDGQLVATVYGVRDTCGSNRRRGIRPLEARLVQLLAESVAVGIGRLQQETEFTRTRVLLEHAFSPTVAEYIQQHPDSLSGQQREVTLLFADLRGYTTLAETMQLTDCYDLLGDVMEALTQVVVGQRGVVVDYYGDGLLALWNAPLEQPDHADLACTAAVEMFEVLPTVADKWRDRLTAPLEIGIGIHSGPAYVGNAGTRSRLKYGPRGNTVNVASRVQAASKQLDLPLVITAATQTKLSDKFFTLRVCTAKLPGLEQPAELFTAYPATEAADIKSRLDQYSHALALFESGDLEAAESLLGELTTQGHVTPAQFLSHYTAAQKNGNLGRRAVDKYAAGQGPVIEIHSK